MVDLHKLVHYKDSENLTPANSIAPNLAQYSLATMVHYHNLSITFAALAAAISLSVCCPIGECTQLPNIDSYISTALYHHATPLQARVNVSTDIDLVFRPRRFPVEIQNANNILQEANGCEGNFNFTSHTVGVETPCPWRYECDYNPQRIPAFIFHASCKNPDPTPNPQGNEWDGFCKEVYYPISYLTTRSCDPLQDNTEDAEWELVAGIIPISCNLQRFSSID